MGSKVSLNINSWEELAEFFSAYWGIIVPYLLISLTLTVSAVVHAARSTNFKTGNKLMWIFVIILADIIGPVLYFIIGKGEKEEDYD